jgi:hypothetical protein
VAAEVEAAAAAARKGVYLSIVPSSKPQNICVHVSKAHQLAGEV